VQAKQWLLGTGMLPDGMLLHAAASVCSGFFASLMSTPADVIKTRMMNQVCHINAAGGSGLLAGICDLLHCASRSTRPACA
jgi:hypothetical protein